MGCGLAAAIAACAAPGCSLGEGTGTCTGVLDEPTCWVGTYDLKPDFFAAIPTTNTAGVPLASNPLQIRIQHGGDYETFSDGLAIVVDDVGEVRNQLGKPLPLALPAGVHPPGVPIVPSTMPSIVHATLYLGQTCRTQNLALYATGSVTLNPDGTCGRPDGGDPMLVCGTSAATGDGGAGDGGIADGGAVDGGAAEGGAPPPGSATQVGASTITFNSLFDGNPDESNAAARLTDATFHFYLADPREICPGGLGPPPRCRGELTGSFHFYFERGKPAQPFP